MIRIVIRLAVAACFVVAAVDIGSVVLTRLQLPDDVRTAGQVAAANASGKPVDRQTAIEALGAARTEADKHDITVKTDTFVLLPDGRITLTGTKTAPTLVAGHVRALRAHTTAATTATVAALPFH